MNIICKIISLNILNTNNKMAHITYIDDFNNEVETPVCVSPEEDTDRTESTHPKKTEDYDIFIPRKYFPIEKSMIIKPYKGELNKPPSQMLFATWNEQVAYQNAWGKRRKIL